MRPRVELICFRSGALQNTAQEHAAVIVRGDCGPDPEHDPCNNNTGIARDPLPEPAAEVCPHE